MTVGALTLCCKPAVDDRYNVLKIVLSSKRLPEKISLFLREVVYEGESFSKSSLFILSPDVEAVYRNGGYYSTLYVNRAFPFLELLFPGNGRLSRTV